MKWSFISPVLQVLTFMLVSVVSRGEYWILGDLTTLLILLLGFLVNFLLTRSSFHLNQIKIESDSVSVHMLNRRGNSSLKQIAIKSIDRFKLKHGTLFFSKYPKVIIRLLDNEGLYHTVEFWSTKSDAIALEAAINQNSFNLKDLKP
jgi:hypothetical protein